MNEQRPIVQLCDLRFGWPRHRAPCLEIARFAIQRGERVFLHGPSGSGKTTLLSILGGVLTPQQGRVHVLGTDLNGLSAVARDRFRADHIGFVFQLFNLIPHLSVLENIVLPCKFSRRRRANLAGVTLNAEAKRLAAHLDLSSDLFARAAAELSVGEQQRVAAARALIGGPELVIADEPTSALDADRQKSFLDLLLAESAAAGATVLFVSHDRRLAERFDRVLALPELNCA